MLSRYYRRSILIVLCAIGISLAGTKGVSGDQILSLPVSTASSTPPTSQRSIAVIKARSINGGRLANEAAKRLTAESRKRGRAFTETTSCDYYGCPDGYNITADEYDTFSISGPGFPDECHENQPWNPGAGFTSGGIITTSAVTTPTMGTFSFLVGPGATGTALSIGQETNGNFCQFPAGQTNIFTQIIVFVGVNQHAPSIDISRPCGPCSGHSSAGDPVDVTSGAFSENKTDLEMPGPFGLSFTRHYQSEMSGNGDLGSHWTDNYGDTAFVYTSMVAGSSPGPTTSSMRKRSSSFRRSDIVGGYVDENSFYLDEYRMPHYYSPSGGYDPISGTTLSEDPGGNSSTLTFFDGRVYNFDAAGKLVKKTDRIGNTQTIVRDSNELIRSVQDSLGRQLCFYYNSGDSRIASIGEWFSTSPCPASVASSSVSASYTYDSGTDPSGVTNCTTGQLCSATEPDRRTWTYGYDVGNATYPSNLTAAYDPLGNPEVVNTYSGYAIASQHRGKAGEIGGNLQFSYLQGLPIASTDPIGHTQVINTDTGEATDYYFNNQAMVTSISGRLCSCHGYQSVNYAYDAYDRVVSESDAGNQGFLPPNLSGALGASNATPAPLSHAITYMYGRDTSSAQYPGPTMISETLNANGDQRVQRIAYYPVGDPRQDLARTIQRQSVDSPNLTKSTTYTYSTQGLLTEIDDTGYVAGSPITRTTKMTYDSRGRMLSSSRPRTDVNTTSTMSYFADTDSDMMRAGQLSMTSDALGHQVQIIGGAGNTYDAYGNALSFLDPNGVITTRAYDSWGRVLSTTLMGVSGDALNLTEQNVYDGAGRLIGRKRPLGNGEAYLLDSAGRMTSKTRFDSASLKHEQMILGYDSADELISQAAQVCAQPSATCANWTTTTAYGYGYDTFGELVAVNDPTTDTLNALAPDHKYIEYTNQGRPAAASDENHVIQGDLTGCGEALICVSNYGWTYDLAGRATQGQRFLLAATIDPESNYVYTNYAYDIDNNVTNVTDPNGNVTTYHYDDFGNKLSETSSVSGTVTYSYDADDNLTSMTDATGASTSYTYDALDRPIQSVSTKPAMPTETVTWAYDDPTPGHFGIGRLASMNDPAGTTFYSYERRGLTTTERRVLDGYVFTERYAYDANGNLASMTYADGLTIAYGYDFADRPFSAAQVVSGNVVASARIRIPSVAALSRRGATGRPPISGPTQNRTSIARTLATQEGLVVPHISLRKRGSFLGTLSRVPAALHPREKLDPQARDALLLLSEIRPVPLTIHHVENERYASGTVNDVIVSSTTYAPYGPLLMRAFGNGTKQTFTLDARYRPASNVLTNTAGATIADFQYSEDRNGNVTSIVDKLNALYSRAYAYDDMNRLTASVTGPAANAVGAVELQSIPSTIATPSPSLGVGLWGTAVYQYDRMGNMLNQQVGPRIDNFHYSGTTSKLINVLSTDAIGGQVTYDADGNETAVGVNSYGYSARNEMVRASGPQYTDLTVNPISVGSATTPMVNIGNPWTYKYDGFGTRLSTTINEIAPSATIGTLGTLPTISLLKQPTRYTIPGPDGQLATETSTTTVGAAEYDYVWMGDKPVAQIDAAGTHFDLVDHLNAPIIQTDSTGAISYQADYEPYGKIYALRGLSDPHQPLRLPGQTAEQFEGGANGATDLSYNNARWYRSEWGRYNQNDPLATNEGGMSFSYAFQNPISNIDPQGQNSFVVGAGGTLGGAASEAAPLLCAGPQIFGCVGVGALGGLAVANILNNWGHDFSDSRPMPQAGACPNAGPNDPCKAAVSEINQTIMELQERESDLLNDQHNLYNEAYSEAEAGEHGSYLGHISKYEAVKKTLRNLRSELRLAEAAGCKFSQEYLDEVERYINDPPPSEPYGA